MNLMTQEAQYKNIYQNAASSKESLQRRLKRADEEEVLAQNQIKEFHAKESQVREQLETLKAKIEELTDQITTTRNLLDQKSSALAQQVKHVQTLELERNTAKSKYNTLKKMEDNFEWYRDGVKAIMKAPSDTNGEQTSEVPGISRALAGNVLELMADIIEADPAYETAIDLGESLQYIIVKDQETSIQAIDYLQLHSAGRSGFIPIASVKPITSDGSNPPPSAGLLLNHINVKDGYEKIAQVILGDVILTETIDEAIELFNKNGAFQIVTKNGDVISHQGILVGGSKDKLSGILAKKNEIKELKRQDGIFAKKLDKSRIEQHDMESEVQQLEIDLQKQIEQKNRITENEIEAEKALYKAGEDLKNAHRHLEIVQLEQEQLLGEASDIDDEMTKYNSALSKVSDDINTAQNMVAELSEKISTVSSEMEEFNQSVIDLKLKLTALHARLDNSNSSLKRLKEFHQDGQTRLDQLSREINLKNQKKEASGQAVTDNEEKLAQMYGTIERLDDAIGLSEADYQEIDARLQKSDSKISELKTKQEKILEKFRMLELERSQLKLKRENIANRLEERYQSSYEELKDSYRENEAAHEITAEMTIEQLEADLTQSKEKIAKIVDVNLGAIKEQRKNSQNCRCQSRGHKGV
jgi:chromosome segregation protein